MTDCKDKFLTIYKNYPTQFASVDWLSISYDSVISLTGFTMDFKLGTATKHFTDLSQASIVNLTKTETNALPIGLANASIIVTDTSNNSKPFTTAIPVMVKNWVQGDVKLDTYNLTVPVTLDGTTQFTIKIETAKVSQEWVEGLISAHNTSEQAHQFIQQNLTIEATARASADNTLQANITAEANTRQAADTVLTNGLNTEIATRENADGVLSTAITTEATTRANADASLSTAIDVETTDRQTADSQLQDNITNEETARQNADTNLQTQINGKQPTIADLDTIRANATAGKNASTTIATYGNIVTHNVSEFATSAQGIKADSALQPTDVINDVTHTDTQKPLSALQGKELSDRIQNIANIGRYLSNWNATIGLPTTQPQTIPYSYLTGMYYVVSVIGATNYRPSGDTYTGQASTVVETETLEVGDFYLYDGTSWSLLKNTGVKTVFENIGGSPYDNSNLAAALNSKQDKIDSTHKLSADLVDDSTTTNKFVTAQDKTNWNNKVDKNSPITAGTHTKITYDTKGLVTGGSNLTASDIPDLSATYYSASNPNGYQTASQVNTTVTSYHDSTKYDASNPSGYTSNTGTVTSVAVSMNGSTKGTVTTSGTIDLGTVITAHQDISGKENTSNKVTSISSSSTNTQYPSAKCVYDIVGNIEATLQAIRGV